MKISLIMIMTSLLVFQYVKIQGQDLKIKLKSREIELAGHDFIISKAIDARKNKMMLGTVKRGFKNRNRIASLHKGLEYQFDSFIKNSLPRVDNYTYEIFLVVRELSISESSLRFNEAARVSSVYDFYLPAEGKYKLVYRSQIFLKTTSGIDVTSAHDNLISETIIKAIKEFHHAKWRNKIEHISSESYQEMVQPRSFDYPILSAEKVKKGIYMNLDQFRQNEPVFTDFEAYENLEKKTADPEKSGGSIIVYDENGDAKKITWRIWGFCTGDRFYIRNSHGDFTLLERKGDDFFFHDFMRLSEIPNNQAIRGIMGEQRDYIILKLDIKTGEFIFVGR